MRFSLSAYYTSRSMCMPELSRLTLRTAMNFDESRDFFRRGSTVSILDGNNVPAEFVCEMKTVIVGDLIAEQAVYDNGQTVIHVARNLSGNAAAELVERCAADSYTLTGTEQSIRSAMKVLSGFEPADASTFL